MCMAVRSQCLACLLPQSWSKRAATHRRVERVDAGELPLPIEYQALVQAAGPKRLLVDYVARLKALDPIAAKAVSTLAQSYGLDLEGR